MFCLTRLGVNLWNTWTKYIHKDLFLLEKYKFQHAIYTVSSNFFINIRTNNLVTSLWLQSF